MKRGMFHRGLLSTLVYFTSPCLTYSLVVGSLVSWSLVVGCSFVVRSSVVCRRSSALRLSVVRGWSSALRWSLVVGRWSVRMTTPTPTRTVHDALGYERTTLDAFFAPRTVALIGATEQEGSVGLAVLRNLRGGRAEVYAVNPHHAQIDGMTAYPDITSVPAAVDLAVIVTPAETVPEIVGACAAANVKAAIVISAGFRERGEAGADLEAATLAQARRGRLRVLGPNCLGIIRPRSSLNTTFLTTAVRSGSLGLISQSGALGAAILDWGAQENIGFSAFISVGSMMDIDWGDLIDYLGDDPATQTIVIAMESIGDARSFLSAAREVALTKPIIVIKAGRTPEAARAAAAHVGVDVGSDAVLDAAFRRCGVLRIETLGHLFCMVDVLAKQPRPQGPRLTIITNAGGLGVLATDTLIERRRRACSACHRKRWRTSTRCCPRIGAVPIRSTCWATPTPNVGVRRCASSPATMPAMGHW